MFSADGSKKTSHTLGKKLKCIWKISFGSFRKFYGLLDSKLPLARCQPLKIKDIGIFCWLSSFSDISDINISQNVTPKPINYTIFWKNSLRSFRHTLIFCPNCDQFFAVISRIYKKWAIFGILMTINPGVSKITKQMTPFFSSTLWALSVGTFHFCIARPSKCSSLRSPLCILFWSVKYTFTC